MTRPVLIIRPEPGNQQTSTRARERGLDAIVLPLFSVTPLAWAVPDPTDFDALLLTSANTLRHGGAGLERLKALPVWTVGEATAQAARDAGFAVTRTGTAGLAALLKGAPTCRLLHPGGYDRTGPVRADVTAIPVYASAPQAPVEALARALEKAPVVMLHSPRAARHFAALTDQCGAHRKVLTLVAISAATAQAAGPGWHHLAIAAQTSDEAMLDLAAQLAEHVECADKGLSE